MKTLCWFTTIALALACLSGCKTTGDESAERASVVTSESIGRIVGMQWTLRKMTLNGNEYDLAGVQPFVKFGPDGKVSGSASINSFSGSMQWDDQGEIHWSPLLSTRMAGPPERMNQETAFLEALPRARRLSLEGIHLHAQSADEQVKLIFSVDQQIHEDVPDTGVIDQH